MTSRGGSEGDRVDHSLDAVFEDGLIRDPRILVDPRLLGMLHRELCDRLGEDETDPVLRRAGFFHGLRDAVRVGTEDRDPIRVNLSLALDLEALDDVTTRGSATEFLLRGSFPACLEAEAVISTLGRRTAPTCSLSTGYASGWLSGIWDRDVVAVENECAASGGRQCRFTARTVEAWRASARDIDASFLPFEALRRAVLEELRRSGSGRAQNGGFDGSSAAVHVWGPVMVVPYSGEDTAATVEVVAREVASTQIAVVVVDLGGAVVDDGFAAVALERVVEIIQAGGAEPVIAGTSPLSDRVVSNLGRGGLVIRNDLRSAIAAAFQIAEFHRVGH